MGQDHEDVKNIEYIKQKEITLICYEGGFIILWMPDLLCL